MPADPAPSCVLRRSHRAMATMFEAILIGDDGEHLDAVANVIFEEIDRVEKLLSRFDRGSEVARINREAFGHAVKLDVELFDLLRRCEARFHSTQGCFDITLTSGATMRQVNLDAAARTIRFASSKVKLDLGAIGKGYALDRCAAMLKSFHVHSALLHGGTSSIFALGDGLDGRGWRVGFRNPWSAANEGDHNDHEVGSVILRDRHLSSSAALDANHADESDVVSPSSRPLRAQSACAVIAATGEEAEALSTALLVMGRAAANDYTASRNDLNALWISNDEGQAKMNWITEPLT